jgi:ubiquinone/menaquinone biosynthesis C-methylase UbiE
VHQERSRTDAPTAGGFGLEWSTFRQDSSSLTAAERAAMFDTYFRIFPWDALPPASIGMDVGCGSGRWATLVAPRVGQLHLVDASADALAVARANLSDRANVTFHLASVSELPVADASLDFAYSLGVLHHVPDTAGALRSIARKLKEGAPFLVYLYYAFDNRPAWYRWLWRASEQVRAVVSRLPPSLRYLASQIIAATVYWPLARLAALLNAMGIMPRAAPLAWYKDRSFYVMRTDAYDRFCTILEQRFTKAQIEAMLREAGFENVIFSDREPCWCAVATRVPTTPQRGTGSSEA